MTNQPSAQSIASMRLPLRLGFFLEQRGIPSGRLPSSPYRGLERRYFLPEFGDPDANSEDRDPEIDDAWRRYFEADDSDDLRTNRPLADRLSAELSRSDLELEVVYAEVAAAPTADLLQSYPHRKWLVGWDESLPYRYAIHERFAGRPARLVWLGFDLTYPYPSFHSLLGNQGPPLPGAWLPSVLNANGLIGERGVAVDLMEAVYRNGYDGPPVAVVGVWEALAGDNT